MEILHQLGELFLAALPTVVIVFLFYLFLRASFFKPMERVLAERRARTEGARRAADSAQAAAHEKVRAYQEALKKARAGVYAKEKISGELAAARADLEAASPLLAAEIARAILERRPPPPRPMSETR